jgi:predicted metal-dependent hydrolase
MDPEVRKQQLYYARRELGLCVECGMDVDDPEKFVMCRSCRTKQHDYSSTDEIRAWRREYQRAYREELKKTLERIAVEVQKLSGAKELESDRKRISSTHKCWGCVWSRWHGDRFFCPLVGCVKTKPKTEVQSENKNSED